MQCSCMYVCPVAAYHRSGTGYPLCFHKEETPEEGPPSVPGGIWYLQVCSVSQQRQANSLWHRVQVCLPDRHLRHQLWDTGSWLHFRYTGKAAEHILRTLLPVDEWENKDSFSRELERLYKISWHPSSSCQDVLLRAKVLDWQTNVAIHRFMAKKHNL